MEKRNIETLLENYFREEEKSFSIPGESKIKALKEEISNKSIQTRHVKFKLTSVVAACLAVIITAVLVIPYMQDADTISNPEQSSFPTDDSSMYDHSSMPELPNNEIKIIEGIASWYDPGEFNIQSLNLNNSGNSVDEVLFGSARITPMSNVVSYSSVSNVANADLPTWVSDTKVLNDRFLLLLGSPSEMLYPNIYGGGEVVYDTVEKKVFSVQRRIYELQREYIDRVSIGNPMLNFEITEFGINHEWCMFFIDEQEEHGSSVQHFRKKYMINIETGEMRLLPDEILYETIHGISADYKYFCMNVYDGTEEYVAILDTDTMEITKVVERKSFELFGLSAKAYFSSDNKYLVAVNEKRELNGNEYVYYYNWLIYNLQAGTVNYGTGEIIRFTNDNESVIIADENGIRVLRLADMADITDSYGLKFDEQYQVVEEGRGTGLKLVLKPISGSSESILIADKVQKYVVWNGYYYIYQYDSDELLVYSIVDNEMFSYDISHIGLNEREYNSLNMFISDNGTICNITTFSDESNRKPGLNEGELPLYVRDIVLPEDGETIVYSQEINIFESDDGKYKLSFTSAYRDGDKIYFNAVEKDYLFENLDIAILNVEKELYRTLKINTDNNIPYDYVIEKIDADDSTMIKIIDEFYESLGKDFTWDLSYFNVYSFYEENIVVK